MAGVIDFGKRIKQKLFGSRQMTPAEDAVIKKTLQEIIFDQSKENVNPDYVKVQAEASKNARLQALANTGMSLYDPMYLDAESLEYDTIFVDQKAKELGDKVRDKLIVSLGSYFPQGDFAEEFDGYFRPFIKTMMEEAYRQREEVDFGQVCDRITRLVQNSNYFENKFVDAAKTGSFIDLNDDEMTAEEFTVSREKAIDPHEMAQVPAEAMRVLTEQTKREEQRRDDSRAEADAKAIEHESLTNQKISLLKERKSIREQLKNMPDNEALLAELEESKLREAEFIDIIREAKVVAEEAERSANYAANRVGVDLAEYGPKFDSMQKHMETQASATGERMV